ncbi:hypothetical protein CFB3_39420 [Clostridium folliculivorans]|uniref:Uncharacterized protein n=1 Tax=Clostridium folliculivorans TaxID=2886038 RepID=A0A9W5Y802_9CLOT|nr:hypothetical protein CFOLD11_46450 [Clostridium folliculivorans]GKU31835.1 hypothetical protein CFB3_39420 [Clostridium folliculivorans]
MYTIKVYYFAYFGKKAILQINYLVIIIYKTIYCVIWNRMLINILYIVGGEML